MEFDQFYTAELHESTNDRRIYFYASVAGAGSREEAGILHGAWVAGEYEDSVEDVLRKIRTSRDKAAHGALGVVPQPSELDGSEFIRRNPGLHTHIRQAIELANNRIAMIDRHDSVRVSVTGPPVWLRSTARSRTARWS
jgi:hypothetical protein